MYSHVVTDDNNEYDVYFYHASASLSTGLSSSFITDGSANPTQHLQYLPFGEDFVHQQNSSNYYTPYTFSAKERDMETEYSYFGARYYDAGLSIWLSVDPMADKFPSISSYNYCSLNPGKLIDPDGNNPFLGFAVGFALDVIEDSPKTATVKSTTLGKYYGKSEIY